MDFGIEQYSETYFIVTEDFGNVNLLEFLTLDYSIAEVKRILFCLLSAVRTAHLNDIIHRDIKPSNIIVNSKRQTRLIDWGLAEFYKLGQSFNVRVSTMAFKPPELLVEFRKYNQSLDVWGIGSVFGCLVILEAFPKKAFGDGQDN